jgi:hypothetical protein
MGTSTQPTPKPTLAQRSPDADWQQMEPFWQKYSPYYEFPISSVLSLILQFSGLTLFMLLATGWIGPQTKVPPSIREITVEGQQDGDGGQAGSGGGGEENIDPLSRPMEITPVTEVPLEEVKAQIKEWLPVVPKSPDAPKVEDLPNIQKVAQVNEALRKKLLEGAGGKSGKGTEAGEGTSGQKGEGDGGNGDAGTTKKRALRWEIVFSVDNGREYLSQLAAMKATLVVEQPPRFETALVYRNLTENPKGEPFDISKLPGLYFIDDRRESVIGLCQALGLNFNAPRVIAFFPGDVEEQLAAKERAYRGRKESEIFSTKFKVLVRDGKYVITVIEQIPVRR